MRTWSAGPADVPELDTFLGKADGASAYHDYRWIQVVERSFGHECRYIACRNDDGSIEGVLPLVHLKSGLFGNFLVSMPYFNYGGVCSQSILGRDRLIGEAVRSAMELGAAHIELRQEHPLDNGFPAKTRKVSMRLRLPETGEQLWDSFPSKLRSQVRKPRKEGLTVRIGRHDELENFYRIFSVNMRDLGTPVYPVKFFRNILEHFPDSTWICTVLRGATPMASGFLLGFKETMEIPWASSLRKYNRAGANMLLYWSCLEYACAKGFRVFDFGRSTQGESTFRFKEQWGAKPHPLHWHYWLADGGPLPEINPDNPKYRLAIRCWKMLPVPLTRLLGPPIVRYLP